MSTEKGKEELYNILEGMRKKYPKAKFMWLISGYSGMCQLLYVI